jgi:hypothetical protein
MRVLKLDLFFISQKRKLYTALLLPQKKEKKKRSNVTTTTNLITWFYKLKLEIMWCSYKLMY